MTLINLPVLVNKVWSFESHLPGTLTTPFLRYRENLGPNQVLQGSLPCEHRSKSEVTFSKKEYIRKEPYPEVAFFLEKKKITRYIRFRKKKTVTTFAQTEAL